jgi:hypothetical protein
MPAHQNIPGSVWFPGIGEGKLGESFEAYYREQSMTRTARTRTGKHSFTAICSAGRAERGKTRARLGLPQHRLVPGGRRRLAGRGTPSLRQSLKARARLAPDRPSDTSESEL